MSGLEASRLIGELIAKAQRNGARNRHPRINEARLGMAMKECYRQWVSYGRSVEGQHREVFVEHVIATYELFTEIAQKVEERSLGIEAD